MRLSHPHGQTDEGSEVVVENDESGREGFQPMAEGCSQVRGLRTDMRHPAVFVLTAQVTIVPGLGITLESRRRCGLQAQRRFLEQSTLRSVFINEVRHAPYGLSLRIYIGAVLCLRKRGSHAVFSL